MQALTKGALTFLIKNWTGLLYSSVLLCTLLLIRHTISFCRYTHANRGAQARYVSLWCIGISNNTATVQDNSSWSAQNGSHLQTAITSLLEDCLAAFWSSSSVATHLSRSVSLSVRMRMSLCMPKLLQVGWEQEIYSKKTTITAFRSDTCTTEHECLRMYKWTSTCILWKWWGLVSLQRESHPAEWPWILWNWYLYKKGKVTNWTFLSFSIPV